MQSRFLAGVAALTLTAAVCAATPASAQRWHHWGGGWGGWGWGGWGWGGFGLGLAAGAAVDAAATAPWWGPTYGYYDYGGYWGAPAYAYAPAPAYTYGYATTPTYTYDYNYPSSAYGYVEQPRDEAYCMRRFRSYDPRTGTYLGYDGLRHPCT